MTDAVLEVAVFIFKVATVVVLVGLLAAWITALSRRARGTAGGLSVRSLNAHYDRLARTMRRALLGRRAYIKAERSVRAERKRARAGGKRRRVYVLDFRGDIKASAVASLREEVSAALSMATAGDEIVVRIENAGGLVHDHGLAASQLARVRERGVPLVAAVDKVAASGGYLMASVADRIIAAPFAIVGSIGVIAQLPNFHELLERHGITVEQAKGGEFKRSVSTMGRNTEQDRDRLQKQVNEVHDLFKDHVRRYRPTLDIDNVATGEHWYGTRAKELKLVDEITTSDDYLIEASRTADVYELCYTARRSMSDRVTAVVRGAVDRVMDMLLRGTMTGPFA
jgi:serine protease SohB